MPQDPDDKPISAMVAERGIKTSSDFADFMGALMADIVAGRIEPEIAKAACLAGDKLLQIAKMQLEHGASGEKIQLSGDRKRLGGGPA